MMEWNREKFRKMFPNLMHELESAKLPTVLDHLERCENEEQALEVVEFFEKRGEITREFASFLKKNIQQYSSLFGTRKAGEYERRGLGD